MSGTHGHDHDHDEAVRFSATSGGDQGHAHGVSRDADARYLRVALGLVVAFMAVEVVAALVSGSLALLADAGHMLTDAGALAGSIWALRLAARPAAGHWTFGFQRAEILSAAINGATLLVVALFILYEAVHRLVSPPPVAGGPVIAVAGLGVAVNLVATWVLSKANRTSLNITGRLRTSRPTRQRLSRRSSPGL